MVDPLVIAGRTFTSRLVVGTGKYSSHAVMKAAHEASGTEMVTVAVRRVDLAAKGAGALLEWIDTSHIFILPNTAGCYTADDAVRTARLGREAGLSNWVKLEVIGDQETLFPDTEALIAATHTLVKDGFVVLPYTNDDPIVARKLEDAGAAAVMPLGAPIGSGLGIQNANNLQIIKERAGVPVIVDAGVGTDRRGERKRVRPLRGGTGVARDRVGGAGVGACEGEGLAHRVVRPVRAARRGRRSAPCGRWRRSRA